MPIMRLINRGHTCIDFYYSVMSNNPEQSRMVTEIVGANFVLVAMRATSISLTIM